MLSEVSFSLSFLMIDDAKIKKSNELEGMSWDFFIPLCRFFNDEATNIKHIMVVCGGNSLEYSCPTKTFHCNEQ
jgi:hypothetical protein